MIKEILAACDYSLCAEISLVLFLLVFVAISVRTFFGNSHEAEHHANLALTDHVKEGGHE